MTKHFPILATLSLAVLLCSTAVAADIVLREKVTPVKSVIVLGDIADVQGVSEAEAQRLSLTPLWVAPPVGEKRFVSRQQVRDVLVSRGYSASDLSVQGSPRVTIGWDPTPKTAIQSVEATEAPSAIASNSMGFRVPSTAMTTGTKSTGVRKAGLTEAERQRQTEAARDAILRHLENESRKFGLIEIDFTLIGRFADLVAERTSDITAFGGKSPWTGRQTVTLAFETEKGPVEVPLSVEVFDRTPVLVAKRSLIRGQLITAADVAIETPSRDARPSTNQVRIHSLEDALGREAARNVREGEIVTNDMCVAPQVISRNEIVEVVSASGGIVIRRQCKSTGDARLGDVVEVELLDSKQRLVARVMGPGKLATLGSSLQNATAPNPAPAGYR
ncbi:flagellar basal body P-ring formation chaperone FlgA [Aeoliella sp. SH292]|uniref:flagellar basal body P-ring formation chaperone FlgA n=1 Tax=Aeoliella sp. SH292 TaxID=3454464 RepID=UPI003F96EB8A